MLTSRPYDLGWALPSSIHAANHLKIWKQYELGIVHFAAGYLEW